MKTTIELPDELFREVKATAARRGDALKRYVQEALEEKLAREGQYGQHNNQPLMLRDERLEWPFPPRPISPEEAQQIDEAIEEAFEQVDPEDWV